MSTKAITRPARSPRIAPASARRRRLFFESLEDRRLLAASPQVTLDLDLLTPGDQHAAGALIGEEAMFAVSFDNASTTPAIGYGPFVDVVVNYGGVDGVPAFAFPAPIFNPAFTTEPDGLGVDVNGQPLSTLITATLYGAPVSLMFTPLTPCASHPFATDSSSAPLVVCGAAGDVLVTARLPFGSFAHDQPPAPVIFTTRVSPLADVVGPGNELAVRARGGFEFGQTPVSDPATDPATVGPTGNAAADQASGSWLTGLLTPQLMNVSKSFLAVESETATGTDFTTQGQIAINVAAGQTITNLQVRDMLPNNVVFVSLDSVTPAPSPASTLPGPTPSNTATLLVPFASVTGVAGNGPEVVITFSLSVPKNDANGLAILDPATGAPAASPNSVKVEADWVPVDNRDQTNGPGVPLPVLFNPPGPEAVLIDKSLAMQKFVRINGGPAVYAPLAMPAGVVPGDTIEYILQFQISDYFGFEDLVVDDFYSDGQFLNPAFTPTLTITTNHSTPPSPPFAAANFTDFPFTGSGPGIHASHHLQLRVSDQLIFTGIDVAGQLYGGFYSPFDSLNGDGPTTGEIRFQTIVQDAYTFFQQGVDTSLNEHDELFNNVTITGELLDLDGTGTGVTRTDDSASYLQVPVGEFAKSIYALNGVVLSPSVPPGSPPHVAQGDMVTYRLRYDLTTGDFEDFHLRDFLPDPKLAAADGDADGVFNTVWPRGPNFVLPLPGTWSILPSDDHTPATLLTATAAAGSNSLEWNFGTFADPANAGGVIDILFTATATNVPFADRLFLTNESLSSHQDTHLHPVAAIDTVQIVSSEPNLRIVKGVVKTDNPAGLFSPSLPSLPNPLFSAIGTTGFRYLGGNITSASLPTLVSSNLSNIDAGDLVTFAVAVENTGSGPNGAFDVQLQDTIPTGFHVPFTSGGLNLSVTDGTGAAFTTAGNLFGAGLELVDPGPTGSPAGSLDNGLDSLGNQINNGQNILFITYDLQADFPAPPSPLVPPMHPVAACQELTNTATLLNYADAEAAPNFVPNHLTDTATVTIACPNVTKTLVTTSIVNANNGGSQAAIGETVSYIVRLTVPEGVSPNVVVTESPPPGMAFVSGFLLGIPPAGVTLTGSTTPVPSGNGATISLGTITNANNSNNQPETLVFLITAVVLDVFGNQDGTQLVNQASATWDTHVLPPVPAAPVTVIEPVLTVDKSFRPTTGLDAGDVVTFTITVSNANPSSTDAYDVALSDVIPAGFTFVPFSLTPVSGLPVSPTFSSGTISASWTSFPLNSTSTFTFQAMLDTRVSPCQTITNTAQVTWTSLPGVTANERTGTGVGPNDYFAADSAAVRVDCLTATKSIVATSEPSTLGNQVTIGEIVRYQLLVELPEGSYSGLTLQDFLPSYLQWIDPSQVTVTTVNATSFNLTAPTSITGNVTFGFGSFTNADNDPNAEFLIVEFNALVTNTPLNNAGDVKPNRFDAILGGNPAMPPIVVSSNVVDVVIVEPQLDVNKEAIEDTADHVTYQITIFNTGTSTAFDTTFVDPLYNGPIIPPFDMPPGGDKLILTYTVRVRPCDDLRNVLVVTASSLPDIHGTKPNATGTDTTGDPGAFDGERIYTASDSVTLTDVGGPCGRICGTKWFDENGDGVRQPGEPGIGGVTIFADQDGDGLLDPSEAFVVTSFDDPSTPLVNEAGQYCLEIPAGQYQIREISPAGYFGPTNVPGGFYTVNFTPPFPVLRFDFGNTINGVGNFYPGSMCGIKFDDLNRDGVRQFGEPLMAGVQFELYADQNADGLPDSATPVATTLTDANGQYCFTDLRPGKYLVRETAMLGIAHTSANPPTLDLTLSGSVFVAYAGQTGRLDQWHTETVQRLLAFGNDYPARGQIHLCKFLDVNGNGIDDQNEPSLPGVVFELYLLGPDGNFHLVATQTTNSDGGVTFTGLLPGTYQLVELFNGTIVTTSPIPNIVLGAGQTISFGDCPLPGSITGVKWSDRNNSQQREAGEAGIAGVRIYADLDGDGTYDVGEPFTFTIADDPSTPANETGMYTLSNLPPGTYSIREVIPAGASQTFPAAGAHQVVVTAGSTSLPQNFGNRPCKWWNCEKVLTDPIADVPLMPILKDIAVESNVAVPVFAFIGPFYPYPQVPLVFGIAVIGANNAHGMWQFSLNGGQSWADMSGISPMSAVVLDSGANNRVRFVPMPGFAGVVSPGLTYRYADTAFFGYAILSDIERRVDASQGGGDLPFSAETGTASIAVNAHEARLMLRTTNAAGQPITSVMAGQSFLLEGYVQDTRAMPEGVFAGYEDVLYDASLVRVSGPITFGPQFPNAPSGNTTTTGLLNEVGGVAGLTATGPDPLLLFRLPFTALSGGRADFFNNPAEASDHGVLLYFNSTTTPPQNVEFLGASLMIEPLAFTNPGLPADIDGENGVTSLDALLIINDLNNRVFSNAAGQLPSMPPPGPHPYLDPNGDGLVTAGDALLVIAVLNARSAASPAAGEPDSPLPSLIATQLPSPRPALAALRAPLSPGRSDPSPSGSDAFHSPRLRTRWTPLAPALEYELENILDAVAADIASDFVVSLT